MADHSWKNAEMTLTPAAWREAEEIAEKQMMQLPAYKMAFEEAYRAYLDDDRGEDDATQQAAFDAKNEVQEEYDAALEAAVESLMADPAKCRPPTSESS